MSELPTAEEIVLRKVNARAPAFHEHIARAKLRGAAVQVGDRVVVFEVVATAPEGRVQASPATVVKFE